MEKTVFISSTFVDLKEYRKKVWEKLTSYQVNIRGMEQFGARTQGPLQTCLEEVIQSDIFICIIGYRLGSVDVSTEKSFVQLEYEKAYELKKEIFIYFMDDDNSKVTPSTIDFGENQDKLNTFKSILRERHTIDTFKDEVDLLEKLGRKFEELLSKKVGKQQKKENGYEQSKTTLQNFLLLPKAYSGTEVKLKIKFNGTPFPASKAICKSFYFSYGSTIGIAIKLILPNLNSDAFNYLFLDYKQYEQLSPFEENKELEIYASPKFTENTVDNLRAEFVSRTTQYLPSLSVTGLTSFINEPIIKTERIQAEGQIILHLKDTLPDKK